MTTSYIPKHLQKLKDEQLENCPQNEKLFETLLIHVKQEKFIKEELSNKQNKLKDLITLSNTLNANTKSIIAIMNALIYQEEESKEESYERFFANLGGS